MNAARKHSLEKILRYGQQNKLGAMSPREKDCCAYHDWDKGTYCAIGCLLTPQQHEIIDQLNINDCIDADALFMACAEELGDLETQLGITAHEARVLQHAHDRAYLREAGATPEKFLAGIRKCLETGEIKDSNFEYFGDSDCIEG